MRMFILVAVLFSMQSVAKEIPCHSLIKSKYACEQCFASGNVYVGNKDAMALFNALKNNGDNVNRYYKDDIAMPEVWNTYGESIVTFKMPEWEYSSELFKNCEGAWCKTPVGRELAFLKPGDNVRWIQTKDKFALQATNIDLEKLKGRDVVDIRDRNFTVVYKNKAEYRSLDQKNILGVDTLTVCDSIGVHFCGDGVIEPGKEICDDGKKNGLLGACNSTCTGKTQK